MKVGDTMLRTIRLYDESGGVCTSTKVTARCIWIHPQRRFYCLELLLPGGRRFRTCEYFPSRRGED